MRKAVAIIVALICTLQINAQSINWSSFMSRNDMIFDTLTTKWETGIFTGNGLMGAMLYLKDKNTLRLEIGRTDVVDHRDDTTMSPLFAKARLPIGYFTLHTNNEIKSIHARMHIWNAEVTGDIMTNAGVIHFRTLTLSQKNIIVFETKTDNTSNNYTWKWNQEISASPRYFFMPKARPANYSINPKAEDGKEGIVGYALQPMTAGGDYTTAWKTSFDNGWQQYFITVGYSHQNKQSTIEAFNSLKNISSNNLKQSISVHQSWWHHYYQKSFVSVPDGQLENFYWIQMYKLASATRADKPAIDLMGPWMTNTPWPTYWYNLNFELTYSPLFASNHLALVRPYKEMFDKNFQNLILNVPPQYRYNASTLGRAGGGDMRMEVSSTTKDETKPTIADRAEMGDLTWCLYYYWEYYRYTMNPKIEQDLLPLLKRSINYYMDVMSKGTDGKWHLPYTYSPEYPGGITRDCNYDLSLFRWGCSTLLKITPNDKLAPQWEDILKNLTAYPTDKNGLMIGKDVAFALSHRHYSHMLMIYPLHLLNWEQLQDRSIIDKSFKHWASFSRAFAGFSFTGGSAIFATMNQGDSAYNWLKILLDKFVKPNTLYMESGPVIESPLAAATSMQEMLLQSWNGIVRVFPAIPTNWKNLSFQNWRAKGAFVVSAVYKDGAAKWIKIKSLTGGQLTLKTWMRGKVQVESKQPATLINKGNDLYSCKLLKGQTVLFFTDKKDLNIPISVVPYSEGKVNYWGTKKERLIK